MKKLLIVLFCSLTIISFAQSDTKAKLILDKVEAKTKAYKTIKAEFINQLYNKTDGVNESFKGKIYIKGNKYKIILSDMSIYNNGVTVWRHYRDDNEVEVLSADESEMELMNPTALVSSYKKNYRYKFVKELFKNNRALYEINLFPIKKSNLNKIKLLLDKDKHQIYIAKFYAKDGNIYTLKIYKMTTNLKLKENFCVFQKNKYPSVDVIDLR